MAIPVLKVRPAANIASIWQRFFAANNKVSPEMPHGANSNSNLSDAKNGMDQRIADISAPSMKQATVEKKLAALAYRLALVTLF
jgi:hypothetical protein